MPAVCRRSSLSSSAIYAAAAAGLSGRILAARIFAARAREPPITSPEQIGRATPERGEGRPGTHRRRRRGLAAGERQDRSADDERHTAAVRKAACDKLRNRRSESR